MDIQNIKHIAKNIVNVCFDIENTTQKGELNFLYQDLEELKEALNKEMEE